VSFAEATYRLVRRVPRGRVVTYGQVAALLGRPRGARAVGQAMRACPHGVPWHRVVNARGGISARPRMEGMATQRIRLQQEGVAFRRGVVNLSRYRWHAAAAAPRRGSMRAAAAAPPTALPTRSNWTWSYAAPAAATSRLSQRTHGRSRPRGPRYKGAE
jgi:methylated-DNA-protein-cysteine methyltransferase-like protein